jgi:uncharacterized protein
MTRGSLSNGESVEKYNNQSLASILCVVLPITALAGLVLSSYLWYKVFRPEPVEISRIIPFQTSPQSFSNDIEEKLRAIMAVEGVTGKLITANTADPQLRLNGKVYRVRLPRDASLKLLNVKLTAMVEENGGSVIDGKENPSRTALTLTVGVGNVPTDLIILQKSAAIKTRTGKMAIIIDDLGSSNLDLASRLCDLEQTVTLSILPFQPATRRAVQLARETKTPYLLHIPMEPSSSETNPGEGAITSADTDDEINNKLERAFNNVPGATGSNNHMGSKVTENIRVMETVMDYFREKEYFFIDSQTSRQSQAYNVLKRKGVKGAKMTSYLDVEDDPVFIGKRLDELAARAFDGELVIAIGHDRSNTVDVLERKLPELAEEGMEFVSIEELVR